MHFNNTLEYKDYVCVDILCLNVGYLRMFTLERDCKKFKFQNIFGKVKGYTVFKKRRTVKLTTLLTASSHWYSSEVGVGVVTSLTLPPCGEGGII